MRKEKKKYIKATKEGRLYIKTEDLLKSDKVKKTIAKLMESDIVKEIEKKNRQLKSV